MLNSKKKKILLWKQILLIFQFSRATIAHLTFISKTYIRVNRLFDKQSMYFDFNKMHFNSGWNRYIICKTA